MLSAGDAGPDGPERLRVVYIDNDPLAVGALESLITGVAGIEIEAASCQDGIDTIASRCLQGRPVVALIDLFLQPAGPDGIELARDLQARAPGIPVAICTVSEHPADAARAWSAGIPAYLTKHTLLRHRNQLGLLLWSVGRGHVVYHVDPRTASATPLLSGREIEILQRKLDGEPHRAIAADLHLSVRTIDSHLANARSKLAAESIALAVEKAVELGFIRPGGPAR